MTGEAILMMVAAMVVIWGGAIGAYVNLAKRGTEGDD